MKKLFSLVILFVLCCSIKVNAQYCGTFNGNLCPPDTQTVAGFSPSENNLPCIVPGVAYSHVIQVFVPSTFVYSGLTLTVNSVVIDTISNLPCGMCWSFTNANNTINGGSSGCILLSGTTTDAPGQYLLHVIVDANISLVGNLKDQNLSTLGLNFYVRVSNNGTCDTVNTSLPSNTASSKGTTPPPTITGNTVICSGSTTLGVSGGSYVGYLWSNGATTSTITASTAGTYSVTVYADCNSATASTTVTAGSASATITAGGPTTFCTGGSVVLTASTGTAYLWSTTATTKQITVTTAGSYTVQVTSGGCNATSSPTVVTVNQPTTGTQAASVCAGSAFSYHGTSYQPGTYTVHLTGSNGCDSAVSLSVSSIALPTVTITAGGPITFCQGGSVQLTGNGATSYVWSTQSTANPITVSTGGSYTVVGTANGCSATSAATVVTVKQPVAASVSASICTGGSYSFNGKSLTTGGTYKDTVPGANGCDSITTLTLTVNPIPTIKITAGGLTTFCQGGSVVLTASGGTSYVWSTTATTNAITVTTGGSYTVVGTAGGCSATSTATVVTVKQPTTGTVNASICAGGSYSYHGTSYTQNGSYTIHLTGSNGCDSAVTLNLTVNPVPTVSINAGGPTTFCAGGSVVLTASGASTYVWSTTATGSTITVTTGGSYTVVGTAGGCSATSTATVVTVNPATSNTLTIGICSGASYNFNGQSLTQAGTYTDTLTGSNTCDSIVTLHLSINSVITKTITASICAGSSYPFNGQLLTVSNTYADTTLTTGGCDSITTLHLTVNQPSASSISASICSGTTYSFNGQTLSTGGVYTDTLKGKAKDGCDSIVTLTLTVNGSGVVTISTNGPTTFCTGGSVVLTATSGAGYHWSTQATTQAITVTTTGSYSVTVTGACGGTSTPTSVTVNKPTASTLSAAICAGGSYNFNGTSLSQAGTYKDTLLGANGCDSIITLTLTVNQLPKPSVTPAGPLTICGGKPVTLNAGAGFTSYLWSTQATTSTIPVSSAGSYSVTVTKNNCQGTSNTVVVSLDTTHPVAVCKDISVNLVNGTVTVTGAQVNNGSTANCGIASMTVSPNTFTAAGTDTVTLTVTDSSGNSSTCSSVVTVNSTISGNYLCDIIPVQATSHEATGSNDPTLIYLGYGPQSVTLNVNVTGGAAPYTYVWTPTTYLNCANCASPVFKPTSGGRYFFNVLVTDASGNQTNCSVRICVEDIRVVNVLLPYKEVYMCHHASGCNSATTKTIIVPENLVFLYQVFFPCDVLGRCGQVCGTTKDGDDEVDATEQTDFNPLFDVIAYPNPFGGKFHIAIASESTDRIDLKVYNLYGQVVQATEGIDPNTDVTLGNTLANGMYIVEVTQGVNRKVIRMTKAE